MDFLENRARPARIIRNRLDKRHRQDDRRGLLSPVGAPGEEGGTGSSVGVGGIGAFSKV